MPQREWTASQLRRMPELRHFALKDPAVKRTFPIKGQFVLGLLLFLASLSAFACACVLLLGWWAGDLENKHGPEWALGAALLLFVLSVPSSLLIGLFGSLLGYRISRHRLRAELRRRGIPICIRCGYEGGDIAAPRCPECGAPAP